jgi:cadmium resistance transport/sequestration family protein
VAGIAATVGTAAVMFAVTNIDDAVVLTALNVASRATGAPKPWEIWAGQYIGIGLMVVVSLLVALGLSFVPLQWVGLLGLVPLARGVALLVASVRSRNLGDHEQPTFATGVLSVIGTTFASGADNISLYTPAFRIMGPANIALTVAVFAVGTALWCLAGMLLVSHTELVALLQRFSRWIVPIVFILLGLYILDSSGLLDTIG